MSDWFSATNPVQVSYKSRRMVSFFAPQHRYSHHHMNSFTCTTLAFLLTLFDVVLAAKHNSKPTKKKPKKKLSKKAIIAIVVAVGTRTARHRHHLFAFSQSLPPQSHSWSYASYSSSCTASSGERRQKLQTAYRMIMKETTKRPNPWHLSLSFGLRLVHHPRRATTS
jgi:hypothetical protein